MILKYILAALLYLGTMRCPAQSKKMQPITKNNMSVSWKIEGAFLHVSMSSPNQGWVAVGFNTADQLVGTNLIMAAVEKGKAVLSDRYIVAVGDHRSVADLGSRPTAKLVEGYENEQGTHITFSIPLKTMDKFHHVLEDGKTYYLLMAYSMEDDFQHHSMMRTSVMIRL